MLPLFLASLELLEMCLVHFFTCLSPAQLNLENPVLHNMQTPKCIVTEEDYKGFST